MVTNLKRSKKIRAFCYRMIAVAALVTAIGSVVLGREAFLNAAKFQGNPNVFRGDLFYFSDFQAYVGGLYNNAMVGYAGIGDDKGYPLTDAYAVEYARRALEEFYATVEAAGDDIVYYIKTAEGVEYSNASYPLFSEYDGHLLLPEDMRLCCYWDGANSSLQFLGEWDTTADGYDPYDQYYVAQYKPNREMAAQMEVVIAVREDCASAALNKLEWEAQKFAFVLIVFVASVGAWILFGFCGLLTGKAARQAKEDYAKVSVKLWLEIKLLLAAAVVFWGVCYDLHGFGFSLERRMWACTGLWMYFLIGCFFYLLWVDIRQNGGRVFSNSLPAKCFGYIREAVHAVPWYRKVMVLNGGLLLGTFFLVGVGAYFIVLSSTSSGLHLFKRQGLCHIGIVLLVVGTLLLGGLFYLRKFLKDANAVVYKLSEMRQGRGQVPLKLSKRSLLTDAASDLNELEAGIEKAVEEQSRSNKMKVELITNVSHDLKTPLTAIINYADLLCEEELSDAAADYAVALQRKAYRLKHMVQDVFDLSKATSGNLTVEKTVIDLVKLIKQTLADMDEKIQESDLLFKLNISKEPLLIEADGEKLYRVFQNLFVNALQYSLEHSRVHVQLAEENGYAVAMVKNTSRMELDFDEAEIVERFVRADSSRTTEGSGLGLSIVQSFTEACGGEFRIETDADMFTACIRFPLAKQGQFQE